MSDLLAHWDFFKTLSWGSTDLITGSDIVPVLTQKFGMHICACCLQKHLLNSAVCFVLCLLLA